MILSANQNIDGLDGDTGELIAPCSSKKPSLLITGPNQSNHHENFEKQLKNLVKYEHLQVTENVSTQNPQENLEVLVGDEIFTRKKILAITNRELLDKDVVSQTVPHNNEKRESDFLSQVREKLNDAEYKEFVNFMKALNSKAMKIGHVLQSIARLFSFPDRISLLHGLHKSLVPTSNLVFEPVFISEGDEKCYYVSKILSGAKRESPCQIRADNSNGCKKASKMQLMIPY